MWKLEHILEESINRVPLKFVVNGTNSDRDENLSD